MAKKKAQIPKRLKWIYKKVTLGEMKGWELNPRFSTKAQAKRIIASEKRFGQPIPFVIEKAVDGIHTIIDGHQRHAAWLTVYGEEYEMDAMISNRMLTDLEREDFAPTMHEGATGSWDWDNIATWDPQRLKALGFDEAKKAEWDNNANNLKEMWSAAEIVDYSDLDKDLDDLEGSEDVSILIIVPAKFEEQIKEWLANGEYLTGSGMGKGVIKRCELL